MRQTQIENMLRDHEDRIKELEKSKYFVGVDLAKEGTFKQDIKTEDFTQKVEEKINTQEKQKSFAADGESGVTVARPIPDTPQENNESVEKGLPITKDGVSTTESGDGKSPVGKLKIKSEHTKAINKIE